MQSLKILKLSTLIIQTYFYGFTVGVVFKPCPHALLNGACNMTCEVPDFSQVIQITCNSTLRGSCLIFGCDENMIKEGTTLVHLNISSLSYNDSCTWTCMYGTISSSPIFIPVYSGYSSTPSLTSQQNGDVVNLTATAECLYPSNPNVVVQYKEQGGQYISLSQPAVKLQSSNVQGVCSFDIENRLTAISDVSGRLTGLGGKSVVLRMKFLQYPDAMPAYTNDEGPFYFNKSSSTSEENESSNDNVGAIVGPVIAVIVAGGVAVIVVIYVKNKEEESKIDPQSRNDPKVKELIKKLLDWINHVLTNEGIIVMNIEEDLFDGQILQKLIEKLAGLKVSEVKQSGEDQKQNLQNILTEINQILDASPPRVKIKWSVDSVYSKDLVAILHLLVALANHFQAKIGLPENVSVNLVVETKQCRMVNTSIVEEVINPVNGFAETRIGIPERAMENTPFLPSGQ